MKPAQKFESLLKKYQNDPEFQAERLIIDLTEQISRKLEEGSITRSELAKRLDCTNAYITKLLRGGENLTIRKIVQIANALECTLDFSIIPKQPTIIGVFTTRKPTNADFNRTINPCDDCEGVFSAAA